MQHSETFYLRYSRQIWLSQSPDSGQNSDCGICDLWILGHSFIKHNCRFSRTNDDIAIQLRPVNKLDQRNKTTSKKFGGDVMLEYCDTIVFFRIFGQFGELRRPDSCHRVCKSYSLVTLIFRHTKAENRNKISFFNSDGVLLHNSSEKFIKEYLLVVGNFELCLSISQLSMT